MPSQGAKKAKKEFPGKKAGKLVKYTYGANQSEKRFRLRRLPKGEGTKPLLDRIAAEAVIRPPRSFKKERPEQSFRHAATALKLELDRRGIKGYQEVQVGIHKDGTSLLASTNTNRGNSELRQILRLGSKRPLTSKTIGTVTPKTGPFSARERRHAGKLRKRGIQKHTEELRFQVPADVPRKEDGLHAERRIKAAGGIRIRGIKRPCAHCFPEMQSSCAVDDGQGEGPGPEWRSAAASRGGAAPSEWQTRITRAIDGRHTVDHGSDSDSDDDGVA